jgi:predicted MFS family arabinose efflux permease
LFLLIIANITVKARLPPQPKQTTLADLFRPLTERTYLVTSLASCIFCLGLYVPINYIQAQAVHFGMSSSLAGYLVAILNAASLFGRTLPGFAADKLGAYNVQTFMCFFTALTVLVLWLPAASNGPIVAFAVCFGFGSGALVALVPTIIAQISDIKEIGVRTGLEFAMISIPALLSNPVGGAFINLDGGGYRDCQIWTGCILTLGAIFMAFARVTHGGGGLMTKV